MSKNKYLFPFILICSLFFMWAFLHNINSILIPHLKKVCQLSDTQSSLIDFAVYLGYFVIAIPAGLFCHRFGYKKAILCGLFLYAVGALIFLPAADNRSFGLFLLALFIAASGATFLETVANPYATILGKPDTSEQRLNFAQSFNGLGAFVAPLIGTHFILSGIEHSKAELDAMAARGELTAYLQTEANSLKMPYVVIAAVLTLIAIIFIFTKLPEPKDEHTTKFSLGIFRISHVRWAVIAEFFYVGSQVGVLSFFIRFSRYTANIPEKEAGDILAYGAMLGFMAGRFLGTFFMRYIKPARLLSLYATINIVLVIIAITTHGRTSVYAITATPFFMSIMFPTIFALGIKDLGEETKLASSFLVMSIIGGAFTPLMMGLISDNTGGNIQIAYIMPMICFAFILYFGLKGHKVKGITKPQAALA
ncbi:L-fucose:H+ symporter permease [Puia sp.]|uniref:L-fucose:H+ symporter permease n=1 Tax=Puia sp. TaxID=2045100 RepID=UPI002F3ED4ED